MGQVVLGVGLRPPAWHWSTGPLREQGNPGAAVAIVPFPAAADSWFSYSRVLPLPPVPYHAYAQDQRGRGGSGRPACCNGVEDLAAIGQMRRGDGTSWSRLLLDDLVQQPPREPPQASRQASAREC